MIDPAAIHEQLFEHYTNSPCRYPGKFCQHKRALKRNGQLHRFCEEHRRKANNNQKRWSAMRQQLRSEPYAKTHCDVDRNGASRMTPSTRQLHEQQCSSHSNGFGRYDYAFDCGFQAHEFDEFLADILAAIAREKPLTTLALEKDRGDRTA